MLGCVAELSEAEAGEAIATELNAAAGVVGAGFWGMAEGDSSGAPAPAEAPAAAASAARAGASVPPPGAAAAHFWETELGAPATPPQGAGGSMSAARSAGASDAPQPARGEGAVPFWAIEGEAEKVNW